MSSSVSRFSGPAFTLLSCAWVGALWTTGYLVAPTLFAKLSDRALAGQIAGWLFSLVGVLGIACGSALLLLLAVQRRIAVLRDWLWWVVAAMLAISLIFHFGIQPLMQQLKHAAGVADVMQSALRDRFASWHGVSSVAYLVQSLLGVALLLGQRRMG